jgi:DNA-binding NtrC family response regulator
MLLHITVNWGLLVAKMVLIVEDEKLLAKTLANALKDAGYQAVVTHSAEQAEKRLLGDEHFDLVILDLTLPGGIGGKEALKALIEIDPMVTAIVSSGYVVDSTLFRYEDLGFRGVIVKPYEAAELGRTVRDVISASRLGCEFQRVKL